jgi:hypothetical protein
MTPGPRTCWPGPVTAARRVRRVGDKENVLFKVADVSLRRPDELIREVVYPAVGEQTLKDLVAEANATESAGAGPHCADRLVLALLPADAAQTAGGAGVPLQQHRASTGVSPTLHDSDTSAESVSGSPGSRLGVPPMWVYSSEEPGPAVHLQGQMCDLHLGQQGLDRGARRDQGPGLVVGVQRGQDDLVAATAVLDAQVGVRVTARSPWPGCGSRSPRRGPRPAPTPVPVRSAPAATRHGRHGLGPAAPAGRSRSAR